MEGLHWADYLVFVLFIIISIGIGVYHALTGGRQRTVTEFIMANRNLKIIPTSISLSLSLVSSTTVLVFSGEAYAYGTLTIVWASAIFAISLLIIQQVIIVWLYPMQLTSAFEYFERRFRSRAARGTASCFGIFGAIVAMGIVQFAASSALQAVTGIPIIAGIPVMAGVCTVYTTLGGIKAVVWTDVFQGAIMLIGIIAVLIKITMLVGFSTAHRLARDWGRLVWSEWSLDPRVYKTSWGYLIGLPLMYIYLFGMSQSAVQRHSATRTIRQSRLTLLLTLPIVVSIQVIASISGLYIFSYFVTVGCDPLASRSIRSGSQILPYFVRKAFSENKGFAGFFLAFVYSGALSTVSSCQSGVAANLWEDVFKKGIGPRLSEFSMTFFNKFLVVVVGLLGMTIGLLCRSMSQDLIRIVISFTSVCGAPLLGMFFLGGLCRKCSWQGVVAGAWTGFAFTMWILIGSNVNKQRSIINPPPLPGPTDGCPQNNTHLLQTPSLNTTAMLLSNLTARSSVNNLYMLSFLWYNPVGLVITFSVGILVSFLARFFDRTLHTMEIEEISLIQWRKVFTLKWNPYDNRDLQKEQHINGRNDLVSPEPAQERLITDRDTIMAEDSV